MTVISANSRRAAPVLRVCRATVSITVAALLYLLTLSVAHAMALGDLEARSTLNRAMDLRIPIHRGQDEPDGDVSVRIAPPEVFRKFNIPYARFLQDVRVAVQREGNKRFVRLTTEEPVVEPVIELVLEASVSGGKLFRSYTVLLDPPTDPAAEVAEGAEPATERPRMDSPPRRATVSVREKPAGRTPDSTPSAPADSAPPRSYRVQRNDILARIADEVRRGTGATREQMMMALYEGNPQAFYRDNVNAVKAGAVLNVPPVEEVTRLSPEAAEAEVTRQYEQWRVRNRAASEQEPPEPESKAARAADPVPSAERKMREVAEGRAATPADARRPEGGEPETREDEPPAAGQTASAEPKPEEQVAEQPAAEFGGGQLKLVGPEPESQGGGGAPPPSAESVAELRERLSSVVELNASLRRDNQELWDQLERVEKQVTMLTRRLMEMPVNEGADGVGGRLPEAGAGNSGKGAPVRVAAKHAVTTPEVKPFWMQPQVLAAAAVLLVGLLLLAVARFRKSAARRLRYRWIRKRWG